MALTVKLLTLFSRPIHIELSKMSEYTDVLGKALSYTLEGLRKEELEAAISGLHESVGTSILACAIQTGLLTIRTQLTLEEWDDAIDSMKKAIASAPPVLPRLKFSLCR
ncbi:MAG: hypothetical protein GY928_10325 [Colwellia sp.]|nr:hypothetical protein [Colwellia sp.]